MARVLREGGSGAAELMPGLLPQCGFEGSVEAAIDFDADETLVQCWDTISFTHSKARMRQCSGAASGRMSASKIANTSLTQR